MSTNTRSGIDSTDGPSPYNHQTCITSTQSNFSYAQTNTVNSNGQIGSTNNNNDQNNNPNLMNNGRTNGIRDELNGFTQNTLSPNSIQRNHFFEEIRNGGGHWSQLLRQVILGANGRQISDQYNLSLTNSSSLNVFPLQINGGSENGQFVMVSNMSSQFNDWINVGYLQPGDVILDIQGQQVAGYTQADVLSLLHHCLQSNSATLTVAPRGSLGPELRSYLNTRFQKGSVDHALQGVVRDNLYLRTVPVTTRAPRPGEIPGVDYTFLSVEEFMELERNGSLLESGVYAGNHYGTPKPWARRQHSENSVSNNTNHPEVENKNILPGLHPSSEGKRRRNRSNVEALSAGDDNSSKQINATNEKMQVQTSYASPTHLPSEELGPLPSNWEMSYTDKGEVYFIDHNTGTSHWLDPRLSRVQKTSLEDCADNELPFGWERIEDPHYGTYYIDHVNRKTQFENPVIQAKNKMTPTTSNTLENEPKKPKGTPPVAPPKPTSYKYAAEANRIPGIIPSEDRTLTLPEQTQHPLPNSLSSTSVNRAKSVGSRVRHNFFTRNPSELIGEKIQTVLVKSSRGLGFTIVGGDDDDGLDEFLQIKSVVSDGPAWRDGKLRTGDVLVRVNGCCVLGYTHQEMVSIFQGISPGEEVELQVCRGYPLPFDPTDPNTEIVTTVAVAPLSSTDSADKRLDWQGRAATPDSVAHSAHSLPELTERNPYVKQRGGRPASVDLLMDNLEPSERPTCYQKQSTFDSGNFLTIDIVKGIGGFGFTISDSLTGQRVKKVLDASHCGGLEEGDRLVAIDGLDLRSMSHTQVVQILKDFPLGRGASLTIQRSTSHLSYMQKLGTDGTGNYSDNVQSRIGLTRSKTPTADLGRSRIKLRESLPERPKTPLLDSSGHLNLDYAGKSSSRQLSSIPGYHPEKFSGENIESRPSNQEQNFIYNDLNQHQQMQDWKEMTVELHRRQEGFGFRIVGGTEEGSQVSVGHIVPRGAAHTDGRLQTNDQIIAVDGISVIGATHHSVVQLMARSAAVGRVCLTIRRRMVNMALHLQQEEIPTGAIAHSISGSIAVHVTLRRQASEGFGFVIISSATKSGATIGRIVEGSPADRCGQLHVGDTILAVNQVDISQLHHSQVVQLIKDSGMMLTLSVLQGSNQIERNSNVSNNQQVGGPNLENLNLSDEDYNSGTQFISPEAINLPSDPSAFQDPIDQIFPVQLRKGNRGFGFSIRGGKEFQNMPLFVLRLADDGPAALDGRIQVGDQILQINGFSTHGMTHSQAIHIIKSGENIVYLLLRRGTVPLPFLSNFSQAFGVNGQEEEQSVSSNNDPQIGHQNSPGYHRELSSGYLNHA